MPIEKIRQRQLRAPVLLSARAVAPWAATGARGKGRPSRSEVSRKSTYPRPNHSARARTWPRTSRAIGQAQSPWKKVRWARAAESAAGTTQSGICRAIPRVCPTCDCTRYWYQISDPKGPPASMIPPMAWVRPPAM